MPLLFLETPVTMLELLFVVAVIVAIAIACIWYENRRRWPSMSESATGTVATGYAWLRKSAVPVLVLLFLVVYPFTQPFVRTVTNAFYGVHERAVVAPIPEPSKAVYALASAGDSAAIKKLERYVVASEATMNATSDEITADQAAGGGVQYGTFFTKLWITIIFFLLAKGLPWLVQPLTHPAPTEWAKKDYKTDFLGLLPAEKFAAYGRLQYVDTAKFIGAALAAALLV